MMIEIFLIYLTAISQITDAYRYTKFHYPDKYPSEKIFQLEDIDMVINRFDHTNTHLRIPGVDIEKAAKRLCRLWILLTFLS